MIDKSRFAKAATGTIDITKEQRPAEPPSDDRDLDDAFSAWDEDDVGAQKPAAPSQLAQATSSMVAKTRVGHKPLAASTSTSVPAPPRDAAPSAPRSPGESLDEPEQQADAGPGSIKLTDPVSMHDNMLSRAHTIDDPLTTGLLAEISRNDRMNDRLARTRSGMMFLPTAGVVERARERRTSELSEVIVTDEDSPRSHAPQEISLEDELRPRRPTTRRLTSNPKDEPFRKK